jgi:hypothetical protein
VTHFRPKVTEKACKESVDYKFVNIVFMAFGAIKSKEFFQIWRTTFIL